MSQITQIQIRRDTAANWYYTSSPYSVASPYNPILALGEIGFETDTKQFKIGDGVTAWKSLVYFTQTGIAGGAASLDSTGLIPIAQIPTIVNKYALVTPSSGALALSLATAVYQKFTVTAATTLSTAGWPVATYVGELFLEVVNGAAFTLNWPVINWVKSDGTFSTNVVNTILPSAVATLQTSGTDFVFLWSHDAGVTIFGKVMR